jgi:hypothetical protein
MVAPRRVIKPQRDATLVKLPPWDTPTWRLPHELRPFYAAVNRLHQLEAKSGASRQRSPQPALPLASLGCNWCGSSMRCGCFEAFR